MLPSEQPDDKAIIIKLMVPNDDIVFIFFLWRGVGSKGYEFFKLQINKNRGREKNKQTNKMLCGAF